MDGSQRASIVVQHRESQLNSQSGADFIENDSSKGPRSYRQVQELKSNAAADYNRNRSAGAEDIMNAVDTSTELLNTKNLSSSQPDQNLKEPPAHKKSALTENQPLGANIYTYPPGSTQIQSMDKNVQDQDSRKLM